MKKEVVVTGMSWITPLGAKIEKSWDRLIKGENGITPLPEDLISMYCKARVGGVIPDSIFSTCCEGVNLKKEDRSTALSQYVVQEAIKNANIETKGQAGVILGTGFGVTNLTDELYKTTYINEKKLPPFTIPACMENASASKIAMRFGLSSYNSTLFTACSAGVNAIGSSYRLIRDGYEKRMIAVGVDAPLSPVMLEAWSSLRVISVKDCPEQACKPFSEDRSGLVIGEGAACLVLEEKEHAIKRGAKIYGEIAGYASNCDASHLTRPNVEVQAKAIQLAVKSAKIKPSQIDLISAHGTATKVNDFYETQALKKALGDQVVSKIPINALKSQLGHSIGASGAIETIAALMMMEKKMILPTINYVPDKDCDLNIIGNKAQQCDRIQYALKTSFGFGGNNAVLVLKK